VPHYYHGPVAVRGRTPTGGKIRKTRKKRKRELGRFSALTKVGERRLRLIRAMGGNYKLRLLSDSYANVVVPGQGTKRLRILEVVDNPASKVFRRYKIITCGAVIRTELGLARVTSSPGQHGVINAVLLGEEASAS